ncbi:MULTISPECIES: tRNA epoxyqueuosine(34) reductase QueG [Methylobacterium]|uniref:tRNA epoxyqueuosine(34) reductase QueG n=1 Tax=Methylobacterium TaxID=407 RepID=UPI0013EB3837|nr:tRNA epoxyqueuosine(34) reductase QueG [Methylobacterium sp. DB0501]NGM33988.1 tRNA epoxyqueuosine(34) reductase QueG [Methylobacterium sp. DB0501]
MNPKARPAPDALRRFLETRARALGFDALAVTRPGAVPALPERLSAWLAAGHHADMGWMEERTAERADPARLWPEVRSVVMLGVNAGPEGDPLAALAEPSLGSISVYARRRDYHGVIKGKLKELGGAFAAKAGAEVKVFVDTAPVMEKPLAAAAGLGWQGKHSVLVSRAFGNWLLLGAIYTTAELPEDAPEDDHCGRCRRCLDACPTDALPAPYRLDARRCLAYLTIEHAGPIPAEFRAPMGNRVFGCDDCLAVCPWNKFAAETREARLAARDDLAAPPLAELARLDDAAFRLRFAGTPIKRTGRDRFLRNVLIAIGNSGDEELAGEALRLLGDASPLVRGMAVWALARLGRLPPAPADERDPDVLAEWETAKNPGVQRAAPLAGAGRRPA